MTNKRRKEITERLISIGAEIGKKRAELLVLKSELNEILICLNPSLLTETNELEKSTQTLEIITPNRSIRVSGEYVFNAQKTIISFEIDKEAALRAGYITPSYVSPDLIPFVFGELLPRETEIAVYRNEVQKYFNRIPTEHEVAEIVSREMNRYDTVLAMSKIKVNGAYGKKSSNLVAE
jgi:hypothetical protein